MFLTRGVVSRCEVLGTKRTIDYGHNVGYKKDLIQAYLMLKRSEEELALLEKEKLNTLEYWSKAVPT